MIVFQVKDSLFKVPRERFDTDDASYFRKRFRIPDRNDQSDLPIVIDDDAVAAEHFELFLECLYPTQWTEDGVKPQLSSEQWRAAGYLARHLGFIAVVEMTKRHTRSNISWTYTFDLAKRYQNNLALMEHYIYFVKLRKEPLTSAEMTQIGFEDAAKINNLRESLLRKDIDLKEDRDNRRLRAIISRTFRIPV